jgi:hypothetical protein
MADSMPPLPTSPPRRVRSSVVPNPIATQQIELAKGTQQILKDTQAIQRDIVDGLKDLRAVLASQAAYAATPVAAAQARTGLQAAMGMPMGATAAGIAAGSPPTSPGAPAGDAVPTGDREPPLTAQEGADLRARTAEVARVRASQELGKRAGALNKRLATGGFGAGRQEGWGGVKARGMNRIARSFSEMQLGGDYYEQVDVPIGLEVGAGQVLTDDDIAALATGFEGDETQGLWRNKLTGEIQDEAQAQSAMKQVQRAVAIRTALAKVGSGGSLQEGVAAGLPKLATRLGYAGLAVGAGAYAFNQYVGQQEANRNYQAVLGGGNAEGFGERFRQNAFRIGNLFSVNPIRSGESESIYQSALGMYAGDRGMRTAVQGQMTGLYRDVGMSPDESARVFEIAAQRGNTALGSIAQALRGVTETAREAGLNAQEARQQFTETFRTMSTTFSGQAAVSLAAAQTDMLSGLGRPFAGANVDMGPEWMRQVAGFHGVSPTDVYGSGQSSLEIAQMSDEARQAMARNVLGPVALEMDEYTRDGQITRPEREAMGQRINALYGSPEAALDVARSLGFTDATLADAGEWIALAAVGGAAMAPEIEKQMEQFEQKDVSFQDFDDVDDALERGQQYDYLTDLGLKWGDARKAAMGEGTGRGRTGAASRYMELMRETGKSNPVIEHLLRDYEGGRRYRVKTADGDIVVGNFGLIEDFADQAATGDVEILEGSGRGMTLGEYLEMPEQGDASETESAEQEYTGSDKKGDVEDYTDKPGSGVIVIRPAAGLQRFIDIDVTGGGGTITLDPDSTIPHAVERAEGVS